MQSYSKLHVNSVPPGLAASLSLGAATEMVRRASGQSDNQDNSLLLTEANLNRLVSKLSKMRGAALKMGQFMSIQGYSNENILFMAPELINTCRHSCLA